MVSLFDGMWIYRGCKWLVDIGPGILFSCLWKLKISTNDSSISRKLLLHYSGVLGPLEQKNYFAKIRNWVRIAPLWYTYGISRILRQLFFLLMEELWKITHLNHASIWRWILKLRLNPTMLLINCTKFSLRITEFSSSIGKDKASDTWIIILEGKHSSKECSICCLTNMLYSRGWSDRIKVKWD